MDQPSHPKQKVREYIERRQIERRKDNRAPLPAPEEIRKEIGWDCMERRKQDRRNK